MKHLFLFGTLLLNTAVGYGQTAASGTEPRPAGDNPEQKKNELLVELQALEADSSNLQQPLALASAKINIAKAAWALDRELAKKLLRETFNLTLPTEEETARLRERPVVMGPPQTLTTGVERLRGVLRFRALEVANRDRAFGEELTELLTRTLGEAEAQRGYSSLAYQEAKDGNVPDAVGTSGRRSAATRLRLTSSTRSRRSPSETARRPTPSPYSTSTSSEPSPSRGVTRGPGWPV
jgi:hypothetical protein